MKQIDRLRSMNAEELAEKICEFYKETDIPCPPCENCKWYWLRTPTGRMKKEAKKHCSTVPMIRDCELGVKLWLESGVEE